MNVTISVVSSFLPNYPLDPTLPNVYAVHLHNNWYDFKQDFQGETMTLSRLTHQE
jgi:hypothetical protein